ncbi:DUF6449 domain-containing protein [Brotaphodocola sp.]|uniref:DUF6449 domain-containing protein n=1 Tax=Brotaphodocola sp. TaxID=3073577 RepID=UPI003D7E0C9A
MTSKNLFFKLMKEDLRSRIWALALIGIGFFFLYPVTAAFLAGEIQDYPVYEQGLLWYRDQMQIWLSFENGAMVLVMAVAGLVCGLSGFSYLNSRSKVDFYHSLPVRREIFYAVNFVDGIVILALPYAISLVLGVIIAIGNGVESPVIVPVAVSSFGLHMTYFMLIYTTVITAAMLTGNLIVGILGCMVLAGFVPCVSMIIQGYFSTFFQTYAYDMGEQAFEASRRISPILEYMMQIEKYQSGHAITGGVAAAWAVSALLTGFSLWLYRKRPSEASGKAMAFSVSCPVIRIPIAVLAGLSLALMFWEFRKSTGWAVFGVICGVVLAHCVIEIIYHFDFRQLFKNRGQLVACLLAAVAVLFAFRYDTFGYDRYLPSAGKVKSGAVWMRELNGWVDYGTFEQKEDGSWIYNAENTSKAVLSQMHSTDVENLLALATAGVEQTPQNLSSGGAVYDGAQVDYFDENSAKSIYQVMISYELKSGRKVYRQYYIDLDSVSGAVNRLFADEEFQKANFPLLAQSAENVDSVYFRRERTMETKLSGLTDTQKKELLEAYQDEFSAMTLERLEKEAPIGLIRFVTEPERESLEWQERRNREQETNPSRYWRYDDFTDMNYYPVYPSFTKTIALLKAQGAEIDSKYAQADIRSVQIYGYRGDKYRTITITDPKQIDELRNVMTEPRMLYYNRFYQSSDLNIDVTMVENGETLEYDVQFPRDQVPDFVKEQLNEAKPQ